MDQSGEGSRSREREEMEGGKELLDSFPSRNKTPGGVCVAFALCLTDKRRVEALTVGGESES